LSDQTPSEEFSYWKRPWQKWLFLVASVLQFVLLFMNIQDYSEVAATQIFSPDAWDRYALQQTFRISLHAHSGIVFLAVFLIGTFAKTKRQSKKAESLLLITLAVAWIITGMLYSFSSQETTKLIWILLILLMSFGAIFSVYKYYKS
jgi:hypothetical protein